MTGADVADPPGPLIDWREELTARDRGQIHGLIAAATTADGVAPVGDQVLRELEGDCTGHLLAIQGGPGTDGGGIVGYLNLAPASESVAAMAEVTVHPEHRRRGIGSTLIRTGLAAGGTGARVWAHGNLAAARATAASLGLVVRRELLQMRRALSDLPAVNVPDGVRISTYSGAGDDAELLRVNNAAFAWHPEQGGWTAADIAGRRGEGWFDPAGLFLATDEASGRLLGFHWTKVHGADLGEVYVVGVDPAARGRALGFTLTLIGLHHLAQRLSASSRPTVMLYVEADNSVAVSTYRRMGFDVVGVDVAYAADS